MTGPKGGSTVDKMMTIDEAADCMRMSKRYVRCLVAERRIPFHKLGRSVRLAESDIAAFLAAGRVEPVTAADVWADIRTVA
jgi:excisionase family DNA binding protein